MKLGKLKNLQALRNPRISMLVSGFYIWVICTVSATIMAFSLYNRLMQTGEVAARHALDLGQRVIYHLAAGDVDGTPRHTKRESEPKEPVAGKGGAVSDEILAGHEGLAAAPFDAITEQTDKGLIPTMGRDGTLPWKYYSRPYMSKQQRPVIALVITNLGLSKPLTEEVMKLPHTVTLSFSPYASDAKIWAKKARAEGFESLIDLPMEPLNFPISDPGPYGLLNALDSNEISTRMHWIMSRYPGFIGLLGSASEKLTPNLIAMRSLLTELKARGVLLLYKKSPQNTELANLIKAQNMLALGIDAVLDEDLTPSVIAGQLDALADIAKKQGYAVGVGHSYPPTTRAIAQWMEDVGKKGVDIAPVSAVAKKVLP